MTENILIFGSKPKAAIPLIDVREIFSSNGSAELSLDYFEHVNKVRHTCIIGAKSFLKLEDIKNRVIKSQPNEIIVRDYDKNYRQIDNLFNQETIINKFTKSQQFYYQRNFLQDFPFL